MPHRLRYLLAGNHTLGRAVLGVYVRMLLGFQRGQARRRGIRDGHAGSVMVIQRFGGGALDGVFTESQPGGLRGNQILLEGQDSAVFLDFGTSFDGRVRYFEEFLAPRSRTGLLDPIHMGLLPPLRGIYRSDTEDLKDWHSRHFLAREACEECREQPTCVFRVDPTRFTHQT